MRQPIKSRPSQLRLRTRILRLVCLLGSVFLAIVLWYTGARRAEYEPPSVEVAHPHAASETLYRSQCVSRLGEGTDSIDPCSRHHIPAKPPTPPFPRLANANPLTDDCLESWLARGVVQCSSVAQVSDVKLDVVWTWVNGSDTRWKEKMASLAALEGIYSPAFHFR